MGEPITLPLSDQLSALGIDREALALAESAVAMTVDQMIHRATARVGLAKAGRDSGYSEGLALILTTIWGGTRSAALDAANMTPAPLREDVATVAMLMALAPTLPHNDNILASSDPGWRTDTRPELPARELRDEVGGEDDEDDEDDDRDCSCQSCDIRGCDGDCEPCDSDRCEQCHRNAVESGDGCDSCCGHCSRCGHCHDGYGDNDVIEVTCDRGHRTRYCTECEHNCEPCRCL